MPTTGTRQAGLRPLRESPMRWAKLASPMPAAERLPIDMLEFADSGKTRPALWLR